MSGFDSIRDSPANIYRHILPFCPSSSWLHKWYTAETLQEVGVVKGHPDKWGTCTRVVSLHHDPKALVCWKDTVAVGLDSGDIMILDAITGSSKLVLSGHVRGVTSLAFSLDGTLLVSGSDDDTIKLWDMQTGEVMGTFYDSVYSVAISPDAITIASGSYCDVHLWDVRTGKCHRTIDTTPEPSGVTCLNFLSPAPGSLMSVSGGLVQRWGASGNNTGPTTSGHHIAFSSDGKRYVLCDEGPPTVRDTVSGSTISTLHSPGLHFSRCCFSPSDEFVAGAANATVYVWNVTGTPYLVDTFVPDSISISSLVYSSSLISMHNNGKIRFRRIDTNSLNQTVAGTNATGSRRAKIIYTALQAEEGFAISVDTAGMIERWDLSTGLPKVLLQISEMEDLCGARMVNDGLTVVHNDSCGSNWGVSTWDVKAGKRLQRIPLPGHPWILIRPREHDLGISKDGTTFFAANSYEIQTWSTLTGKTVGFITYRDPNRTLLPFSVNLDGPKIWIHSEEGSRVQGWDLRDLKLQPLDLSQGPKSLRLACLRGTQSHTNRCRIIDTAHQIEVFPLPEKFANPSDIVWDGQYLSAVYDTGELLILDFVHMPLR